MMHDILTQNQSIKISARSDYLSPSYVIGRLIVSTRRDNVLDLPNSILVDFEADKYLQEILAVKSVSFVDTAMAFM